MIVDGTLRRHVSFALRTTIAAGRQSRPLPPLWYETTRSPAKHPRVPLPSSYRAHDQTSRPFSTSSCLRKKGGKVTREEQQAVGQDTPAEDPSDFTLLEADVATAIDRLKLDLSKLRSGGKFNPEVLESLRVQPEKESGHTVRLSDVAQVVSKGRIVQIMVGEKDHIKSIKSSIQSSTLSLTPQPDPTGHDPLLLVIKIPPPTAESRSAAIKIAAGAGDKANNSIRDARGKHQKKLRAMQTDRAIRPDDIRKAMASMEKLVGKGIMEVKRIVDSAKKVLESI